MSYYFLFLVLNPQSSCHVSNVLPLRYKDLQILMLDIGYQTKVYSNIRYNVGSVLFSPITDFPISGSVRYRWSRISDWVPTYEYYVHLYDAHFSLLRAKRFAVALFFVCCTLSCVDLLLKLSQKLLCVLLGYSTWVQERKTHEIYLLAGSLIFRIYLISLMEKWRWIDVDVTLGSRELSTFCHHLEKFLLR